VKAAPAFELDRPIGPLGFVLRAVGAGTATWEYTVDPAHFNPNGVLHGGVLMSLLDTAMGHAVYEAIAEQGRFNVAAQFNVHFLEPIRAGVIRAHGTVIKIGKRTAVVEGKATNEADRVVGVATATHSLLP
jgi:uncharacterized protein (TIGR00369 family)